MAALPKKPQLFTHKTGPSGAWHSVSAVSFFQLSCAMFTRMQIQNFPTKDCRSSRQNSNAQRLIKIFHRGNLISCKKSNHSSSFPYSGSCRIQSQNHNPTKMPTIFHSDCTTMLKMRMKVTKKIVNKQAHSDSNCTSGLNIEFSGLTIISM